MAPATSAYAKSGDNVEKPVLSAARPRQEPPPGAVVVTSRAVATTAGSRTLEADLIDKLMRLAALRLEAKERELLVDNLAKIVHLIDAMQSADTDGVEPLDHPLDGVQPLRPDRVTEVVDRDRFQEVAPQVRDGLYLVPRVVE